MNHTNVLQYSINVHRHKISFISNLKPIIIVLQSKLISYFLIFEF